MFPGTVEKFLLHHTFKIRHNIFMDILSLSQFDNIKVEVAKNTESLQSNKNELNDLRRQKQLLEIDVQSMNNMVCCISLHCTTSAIQ